MTARGDLYREDEPTPTGGYIRAALLFGLLTAVFLTGGAFWADPVLVAVMATLSAAVLIWTIFDTGLRQMSRRAVYAAALLFALAAAGAVQLIPVPPEIWTSLPGRPVLADTLEAVGASPGWMPVSMAPYQTQMFLLHLMPPAAILVLTAKSDMQFLAPAARWFIPAAASVSGAIGIAQLAAPQLDLLYPYDQLIRGRVYGVMQASNHHATLLLIAIPFLGALAGHLRKRMRLGEAVPLASVMTGIMFFIVMTALLAVGSVSGYVLALPALFCAALLAAGNRVSPAFLAAGLATILVLALISWLVLTSPNTEEITGTDLSDGPLSRRGSFATTLDAFRDHFPVGSGLGTFPFLFPHYESIETVTRSYIVNTHNDYLELALELGAAGILLLAAAIAWLGSVTWCTWREGRTDGYRLRRAATIACLLVAAHSAADVPLRTETVACLVAFCVGLISIRPERLRARAEPDVPTSQFRHRTIEI